MALDLGLLAYLTAWYAGNYYYNIFNKNASKAGGGTEFAFTLATAQLAVGALYAVLLWIAPEARPTPAASLKQVLALAPLGFFAAAAHAGAVFSLSAGAVSFAQIVKAAEPAFAAGIGFLVYGQTVSKAKIAMLVPIIGGIWIASVQELDFTVGALVAAGGANVAAAFRGQEFKRAMAVPGIKEAMGGAACSTGNIYAITTLWATVILLPSIYLSGEWERIDDFVAMWKADGKAGTVGNLRYYTVMSGLMFYLYNEVSTIALKKITGVTHSVANTAKRAIIIVGCAIAFGESMAPIKMLGCGLAIFGTFLYAIADTLFPAKVKKT